MYIDTDETLKNLLRIEVKEEITQEEIIELDKKVKTLHEKYDLVNIMLLITHHSQISFKAVYETLKLAINEGKAINKVAIISDRKFIKLGVQLDNLLLPWKERYFYIDSIDEAWNWIEHKN